MVRECAMREVARDRNRRVFERPKVGVWAQRLKTLPPSIQEVLTTAEQEAAVGGWDVHFWLRLSEFGRPMVSVEFKPSFTETVRFYEW